MQLQSIVAWVLLLQHCCLSQAAHLQRGVALLLEVLHQVRHHRLAAVNACLRANLNPATDMTPNTGDDTQLNLQEMASTCAAWVLWTLIAASRSDSICNCHCTL
jgi:hypothetical protein